MDWREAINSVDIQRVRKCLEEGANIHERWHEGETALTFASHCGWLDIVKLLIEHGADLNTQNDFLQTGLSKAAVMGCSFGVVRFLVEIGAEIDHRNINGTTPLMSAAFGAHINITEFLLSKGAKLNSKDKDGETALDRCIYAPQDNLKMMEFLVSKGARLGGVANAIEYRGPFKQYLVDIYLIYFASLKGPLSLKHIILNLIEEKSVPREGLPIILFAR